MPAKKIIMQSFKLLFFLAFVIFIFSYASCKYGFKDVSPIPAEVKNFRVNAFSNRAQYVNTQLAPQLTEKVKQKIINTTRLRQVNEDEADYDISGYISQYFTTTVSITGTSANQNRLSVGFHLSFKNRFDDTKNQETDVVRSYDFPATQSLTQAESQLTNKIIQDVTDDIFNKIFSNW